MRVPMEIIAKLRFSKAADYADRSIISDIIDHDYNMIMTYFCEKWPGKKGILNGCRLRVLPENLAALETFEALGGNWRPSDIEATIRMRGERNPGELFQKVTLLANEIRIGIEKRKARMNKK